MLRRTRFALLSTALSGALAACDTPRPTGPTLEFPLSDRATGVDTALARDVRFLAAGRGVVPLARPPRLREPLVRLGQALAFDRILSGGRDISCMTCHVPSSGTGDGKSLSVGQGGTGLGPQRSHPEGVFIPRNAPPLFNLAGMNRLFWDGRVEVDGRGRLHTPAGAQVTPEMTKVFELGAASALALFPVTNRFEMRGFKGSELAMIEDTDFTAIWKGIMARLGTIPEYRGMFEAAYPGTRFDGMTFAHASNAIGAFFVDRLTFTDSPWDRFLAGRDDALTPRQLDGAKTFLTLKCSICHNGATFSDEQFHDVAVAQIGPGEGNGPDGRDDFGRMNASGKSTDRYLFRTTPLRNVELTAPYGHDGAITNLRAFVEHYSESDKKLLEYDPGQLEAALRGRLVPNAAGILAQRDTLLNGVVLTEDLVNKLMDYMSALTDDAAREPVHVTPMRVPSGLPVDGRRP